MTITISHIVHLWIRGIAIVFLIFGGIGNALPQFSPGELSRVHQQLEGIDNCLQCHETGKEISGKKCLTCHQEIQSSVDEKRGYHYKTSSRQCIECHKEHLGKNANTIMFNAKTFDHWETGFVLAGKHASTQCRDCHAKKNIKDTRVLAIVNSTGRETYLGLDQKCMSCHEDRHNSKFGKDCQTCHTASAWSPASTFDHARTKFQLAGKHSTVKCNLCHVELDHKMKGKPIVFTTKAFSDCTPCHTSPHSVGFVKQECNSCHSPANWKDTRTGGKFNHALTRFPLVGKHATVACEKCHSPAAKGGVKSLKLAYNKCSNCHSDYHKGEIASKKDCQMCHTPFGFTPSTFTLIMHNSSDFALRGAHAATPCQKCHIRSVDGRPKFHFANTRCESCHRDSHGGQFADRMKVQSCNYCHSTESWSPATFDHSKTNFALTGKHAQTKCSSCHKSSATRIVQYRGTGLKCQSCHADNHAMQFAANNETNCESCHTSFAWNRLIFDHEKQSTFALTGAHKRVECRQCHREERRGEKTFIRYKPMSPKCESCHAGGKFGNG